MLQYPTATSAPRAPVGTDAAIITLSKPITGHQGPIPEIRLKEPTFGDWVECGEFERQYLHGNVGNGGMAKIELTVDPEAVARWFQRLSGLPMAVLTQMTYEDSKRIYVQLKLLAGTTDKGNSQTPPMSSG
jgi:hypothetical protein